MRAGWIGVAAAGWLAVGASAAFAQGMPAGAYNWTGFYAGLNAGYGWGDNSVKVSGSAVTQASINVGQTPASLAPNPDGPIFGVQGGYNWQFNRFVVGGEADIDITQIRATQNVPTAVGGGFFNETTFAEQKLLALSTVRARAGYLPMDNLLVYVTGGAAIGDIRQVASSQTAGCAGICTSGSTEAWKVGPTAGAGAEYKLDQHWSLKAEYLWYDLPSVSQTLSDGAGRFPGVFQTYRTKMEGNLVRVGLNFKFGTPPAPMPEPPAPVVPAVVAPPQNFIVFFDFDKAVLTPEARQVLDQAAQYAKANGKATIDVTGYTDLSGTVAYNQRLSERRAHVVAEYLEGKGIPKRAIAEAGRGKSNPRVPTADGVREPQNRRVEITMP